MTDTTQTPPKADQPEAPYWFPAPRAFIVAWMMVSSFIIIVLCWWKPPAADNQLLNTLLGMYVGTGFITAITWWMGSSKGSDDKTALLQQKGE